MEKLNLMAFSEFYDAWEREDKSIEKLVQNFKVDDNYHLVAEIFLRFHEEKMLRFHIENGCCFFVNGNIILFNDEQTIFKIYDEEE